jgi:polysaccharide biosynthesis protein PslG
MTKITTRKLVVAFIAIFALAVLFALDLANHGLAWRTFWSLTGEETPLGQIQGIVEWLGNFTRSQPQTAADIPVQHTGLNPYGINTFLEQEVEPEKRERILQMVSDAGFHWIRQQFPWEDIEIHGRGDFEDRRNVEVTGVISAWDKYDQIVDLAEQYGIEIHARLDNPPAWTHADPAIGSFAPPDDLQDFVNYATAVAERYKGRIRYYQVWNEPNIYPEWGEQFIDPEAYTELLCRTYSALKAVDPEIVVVSGALAPTVSLSGRDLNDFVFLQRMYDAGAGECFDILAVQGYGLNSGPTDQRMRPTTVNFARNLYIRDLMVANGDSHKPIWISEAAWNPMDDIPGDIADRENYGSVTHEQAARYMPLAYQRAQEEWPWVGVIFYWFFKRPSDAEINQSWYYFRMVEPDFTPLPVYESMKNYIASQQP